MVDLETQLTIQYQQLSYVLFSSSETKSPILKIVAICIGVIVFCVVIGIAGYKHLKARRNQAQFALFQRTDGEESESVLLKEQASNCSMTVETERITVL